MYDSANTPSLGRHVACALVGLLAATVACCLALLSYVVATDRMEQAAPLAAAVASPLVALFGSSAVAAVGSYVTQKWLGSAGGVGDAGATVDTTVVTTINPANMRQVEP